MPPKKQGTRKRRTRKVSTAYQQAVDEANQRKFGQVQQHQTGTFGPGSIPNAPATSVAKGSIGLDKSQLKIIDEAKAKKEEEERIRQQTEMRKKLAEIEKESARRLKKEEEDGWAMKEKRYNNYIKKLKNMEKISDASITQALTDLNVSPSAVFQYTWEQRKKKHGELKKAYEIYTKKKEEE